MAAINKVILIGNVGRDPELRYMGNGDAVANVSLATTESWNDKSTGEKQERTEWHRLVFFKRLAEIVSEYATKGKQIYVEGKLQTRKYEKDGVQHYSTEIICHELKLLGGRPASNDDDERPATKPAAKPAARGSVTAAQTDIDDDIPF